MPPIALSSTSTSAAGSPGHRASTWPGNVRPVQEVAGLAVGQVIVGSSANPGYRDFAVVATTLRHARLSPDVVLDVNPGTRQVATDLSKSGLALKFSSTAEPGSTSQGAWHAAAPRAGTGHGRGEPPNISP